MCYHNGHELLNGDETSTYDGDFFVCWLDDEPQAAGAAAEGSLAVYVPSLNHKTVGGLLQPQEA